MPQGFKMRSFLKSWLAALSSLDGKAVPGDRESKMQISILRLHIVDFSLAS